MTRIVCISDTHTQHAKLNLPAADILIHSGDWTHRGEQNNTIRFLKWFEKQDYKHKIFIAGNHDFYPDKTYVDFMRLVKIHAPSCTYLQDETIVAEGFKIHGSPVTPYFGNWAFNRRENEIQKHWDMIPDDTQILVTHGPPYGFGDRLGANGSQPFERVGCLNLLKTIDTRLFNLNLHVYGHIHEGYGQYVHYGGRHPGTTMMVNASVLNDLYNLVNEPVLLEL